MFSRHRCARVRARLQRAVQIAATTTGLGLAVAAVAPVVEAAPPAPLSDRGPALPTYGELQSLLRDPYPEGPLRWKLERLFDQPRVRNDAWRRGVRPRPQVRPGLGPAIRVASWNIEKSLHLPEAIEAFTDRDAFAHQIDWERAWPGSTLYRRAQAERARLAAADVVLLQEMDVGVPRSRYADAAAALARALGMNHAFAPEYVEIDPVVLGVEEPRDAEGRTHPELGRQLRADPRRYRGLFGVAVLSRYPIVYAESRRLLTQGYDWYWGERQKTSFLEDVRRAGARSVFLEHQTREIKWGGRTYLRVDLAVPELPEGRVSIINVHLEIKCEPEVRARQMAEILHYIEAIPHPVILMGDFNSAPGDLSPTSTPRFVHRTLESPEFWLSRAVEWLVPYSLVVNTSRFLANTTKNYQNPTAPHIPLLAPNDVAQLFEHLERFRFRDGRAFDFRGEPERSAGEAGLLSNSNERDRWAYRSTFRLERTFVLVGKYRLDWTFVKGYARDPFDPAGPRRFAPHFGRTLNTLNDVLIRRISDHDPNLVDLPLYEPSLAAPGVESAAARP